MYCYKSSKEQTVTLLFTSDFCLSLLNLRKLLKFFTKKSVLHPNYNVRQLAIRHNYRDVNHNMVLIYVYNYTFNLRSVFCTCSDVVTVTIFELFHD